MSRYVYLDTETTGLDPKREEVFEVAILEEDGEEHVFRLQPDMETVFAMHPDAAEVNQYFERTHEPDWEWDAVQTDKHQPNNSWEVTLGEISRLLDGAHIIGAVPDFDTRFLTSLFARHGMEPPKWHYSLVDIKSMAVGYLASSGVFVPLPWSTLDLSRALGVEPPGKKDLHTALGDACWVREMHMVMTYPKSTELARLENTTKVLFTHLPGLCAGANCTVHNRSDHGMRSFPQYFREDLALMERTCPHGVGHPDPDDISEDTVHGCDGCCATTEGK